ncbi:DUF4097 family beta strand repeat-containing protein [Kribbella sp. CA-247076]|uniref:DUF4097 family beta strand repeat-containing protein n=1 Tax=Kribbella sp. CA-247076 TaxID=3239941 RepID=UPI003D913233
MHTFATTAPVSVVLDIPAGRIQFVATDRTDTTVDVQPANAAKKRDVQAAEDTTVDYADGVLRIQGLVKNQILGSSGSVDVTVNLPAGSQVEAKAASAELRATGQYGDFAYEGAHGAIELDEVANARLTIAAGDVTITRLDGSAEISASKGDIRITDAVRGNVVLRTQAGNITVGSSAAATLDAGTTLGRIDNTLKNAADTPDVTIHATTTQGDITAHAL